MKQKLRVKRIKRSVGSPETDIFLISPMAQPTFATCCKLADRVPDMRCDLVFFKTSTSLVPELPQPGGYPACC